MRSLTIKDFDLIKREIIKIYSQDFVSRLYTTLRLNLAPMILMREYIPERGDILDLGCGNGIMANILSLGAPERKIYGVDLSPSRIEAAKRLSRGNPNLEFVVGDVNSVSFGNFEIITLIDLLHHMPYSEQRIILEKVYSKLHMGGHVLIKDLEKTPYWKYIFHYIQDSISYHGAKLYFSSSQEMIKLLESLRFEVETISLASGYPHPHVLYRCTKI